MLLGEELFRLIFFQWTWSARLQRSSAVGRQERSETVGYPSFLLSRVSILFSCDVKGFSLCQSVIVMGQANAWQPPVIFSGHFQPIQAGPAYVHPTSQTVVVGRTGQVVYVHPIAQCSDKGNAPSDRVGAVCCLLVTEELLKDGKRACLSFCLAAPITRVPLAWDVMKHLNKKIPEMAYKKAQMYEYLLEQEKLRVYPVIMHWWRSFFLC